MNNPGTLDKRISFISYEEIENEYGLTELEPIEIIKCWARIEPARGKEYYEAQKLRTQNSYKITIRYHKNINEKMKIKYKTIEFDIYNVVNPYMHNELLEIYCVEKIRD